jgi:hypothetical protein
MAAVKKEAEEIGKMHTPVRREVWWAVSTPLFGSESAEQHHGELLGARADMILNRLYPEQPGHSDQIQKCCPDISEGLGGSLCSLCCWREGCDNLREG